ncbi:MAG TPA: hypothetical protein DD384_06535 [Firmicutes bacterium]|nr:hypothetical protein [Bacillota bacterium]
MFGNIIKSFSFTKTILVNAKNEDKGFAYFFILAFSFLATLRRLVLLHITGYIPNLIYESFQNT